MASTSDEARTADSNISWLKPQQVEAMRDAAHEGRHGPRDDAIVTLLYDTGLRRGELAQVDRGMLDLDDAQLRVPVAIQKDYPIEGSPDDETFQLDLEGDLRTVRTLRAYLATREDTLPALFPSQKSDRMTGKAINDVVKRLAGAADVRPYTYRGRGDTSDVSAHTLRHSVAYHLLHTYEGYTLYDVRNRLRHARLATTEQQYDHFDTI